MDVQTVVTVFNARAGSDRREVFMPTVIGGASYQEVRGASSSKGVHSESLSFKLRIPIDAKVQDDRSYVGEAAYKALSDDDAKQHWTLRKGDYIIAGAYEGSEELSQQELDAVAKGMCKELIRIAEYADNTLRGSDAVKHWRIGGA